MRLIKGLNRTATTTGGGTARIICRPGAMLLAALSLPGCAVERWEKPGATEAEFHSMKAQCNARAYERAPPLTRTESRTVSRTRCNSQGKQCHDYYATEYSSVDLNERTRDQVRRVCYAANGWIPKD